VPKFTRGLKKAREKKKKKRLNLGMRSSTAPFVVASIGSDSVDDSALSPLYLQYTNNLKK